MSRISPVSRYKGVLLPQQDLAMKMAVMVELDAFPYINALGLAAVQRDSVGVQVG